MPSDTAVKFGIASDFYWNVNIQEGRLFPPFPVSVGGSADSSKVFKNSLDSEDQPMRYQYLAPHMLDGDVNYFKWPEESDNSNRRKLVYVDDSYTQDCLKSQLPQMEIAAACIKTSTYELKMELLHFNIF